MIKAKQIIEHFGGADQTQAEAARNIGLSKTVFTTWNGIISTRTQYMIIGYLFFHGKKVPKFLLKE